MFPWTCIEVVMPYPIVTRERQLELVRKAQAGCIESRNLLVRCNFGLIRMYAKRAARKARGCDYEDLLHDGFVKALECISKFRCDGKTAFSTYLTVCVGHAISDSAWRQGVIFMPHRHAMNISPSRAELAIKALFVRRLTLRNGRHRKRLAVELHIPDNACRREEMAALYDAIRQLPKRQRYVIRAGLRGIEQKAIAKRLGKTHQTISLWNRAAMRALGDELEFLNTSCFYV